jgi:hypothetical protein
MRPFLPALLLLMACSSPAAGDGVKTLVVHDVDVELGAKATTVSIPLADSARALLAVARDANRSLVLRVEEISVEKQPGVIYEVRIEGGAGEPGVLSFYGAEESNGEFMASFPIDEAAAKALRDDSRELRVTFTPRGVTDEQGRELVTLSGKARFSRLRLVEE